MYMLSALVLFVLLAALPAQAASAKIRGEDSNGKKISIALDAKGSPRINDNARSYPTIKDFREDGEVSKYCFEGSEKEVRALLSALVSAANGDGDSWAELKGINKNRRGNFVVIAEITDEGGKREENYLISECK